jgi:hypothetical protein
MVRGPINFFNAISQFIGRPRYPMEKPFKASNPGLAAGVQPGTLCSPRKLREVWMHALSPHTTMTSSCSGTSEVSVRPVTVLTVRSSGCTTFAKESSPVHKCFTSIRMQ